MNVPPDGPSLAPQASLADVQASLWCGLSRTFATEDDGRLRVEPGKIALSFRLRRDADPRPDEPVDAATCFLRLADDRGDLWESASTFSLHAFVEQMINLDRANGLAFFDNAPQGWKEAFNDHCLMSGARSLLDDRGHRKFLVGDQAVELAFKYQCPTFDVAPLAGAHSSSLLVRASGFRTLDGGEIPPLAFEMPWQALIFRNELHFDPDEGWWMKDGWPLPITFRKAEGRGEPQPLVRHETGRNAR
jgi:hypothetical protein